MKNTEYSKILLSTLLVAALSCLVPFRAFGAPPAHPGTVIVPSDKRPPGFNPASNDWLFMMIRPDGGLVGITQGRGAENVAFCSDCHNRAPAGQDNLFLMPENVRRR